MARSPMSNPQAISVGGSGSPGEILDGRFRLEWIVGEGGMGVVWAATRLDANDVVALKVLNGSSRSDTDFRRLLREAHAALAVDHPNVLAASELLEVPVAAAGEPVRLAPVIVMPLLNGETLARRLDRTGALPLVESATLLLPIISAIGTAHAHGIVHRDLKPDNIFIVSEGGVESPKVLDFGVAKLLGTSCTASTILTKPGTLIGTPHYMAPEQAMPGKRVDHRADVWSLGAIIYQCLSGIRPIEGDTLKDLFGALLEGAITPLTTVAPGVPEELAALVDAMLRHDVDGRPALHEVARALERYTDVRAAAFGQPESERSGASAADEEAEEEAPVARRFI